jgi:hypothetical protein
MTDKWTAGEWKVGIGEIDNQNYLVVTNHKHKVGELSEMVCVISTEKEINDQDIANARLIAAAPDMIEALISAYKGDIDEPSQLKSVIEKATGKNLADLMEDK